MVRAGLQVPDEAPVQDGAPLLDEAALRVEPLVPGEAVGQDSLPLEASLLLDWRAPDGFPEREAAPAQAVALVQVVLARTVALAPASVLGSRALDDLPRPTAPDDSVLAGSRAAFQAGSLPLSKAGRGSRIRSCCGSLRHCARD